MTRREQFWRALRGGNYKHARVILNEVLGTHGVVVNEQTLSRIGVLAIGSVMFGPDNAFPGVTWVNDSGKPGPQNWRLAGTEPK